MGVLGIRHCLGHQRQAEQWFKSSQPWLDRRGRITLAMESNIRDPGQGGALKRYGVVWCSRSVYKGLSVGLDTHANRPPQASTGRDSWWGSFKPGPGQGSCSSLLLHRMTGAEALRGCSDRALALTHTPPPRHAPPAHN